MSPPGQEWGGDPISWMEGRCWQHRVPSPPLRGLDVAQPVLGSGGLWLHVPGLRHPIMPLSPRWLFGSGGSCPHCPHPGRKQEMPVPVPRHRSHGRPWCHTVPPCGGFVLPREGWGAPARCCRDRGIGRDVPSPWPRRLSPKTKRSLVWAPAQAALLSRRHKGAARAGGLPAPGGLGSSSRPPRGSCCPCPPQP